MRRATMAGNCLCSPGHDYQQQQHQREHPHAKPPSERMCACLNDDVGKHGMPTLSRLLTCRQSTPQPSARQQKPRVMPPGRRRCAAPPITPTRETRPTHSETTAQPHSHGQRAHRHPQQFRHHHKYFHSASSSTATAETERPLTLTRGFCTEGHSSTSRCGADANANNNNTRDTDVNTDTHYNSIHCRATLHSHHNLAQSSPSLPQHRKRPQRQHAKARTNPVPRCTQRRKRASGHRPLLWAAMLVLALNCIDVEWLRHHNTFPECGPAITCASSAPPAPPLLHGLNNAAVGGILPLVRLSLPGAAAASRRLPPSADIAPFTPTFTQAKALQHHHNEGTRVMVMVNGDCNNAKHTARAIYRTWSTLPGHEFVAVRFVIGDSGTREMQCSGDTEVERNIMVYLGKCSDAYPPVDKVLCMWEHARSAWLDNYDFFLKVDADTYLNLPNLLVLLAQNPPSRYLFAGSVGRGRNHELPPYCMGPAYVLSHNVLRRLPGGLSKNSPRLPNSDTTFSALVKKHTNVSCLDGVHPQFRWSFMNRYWDFKEGEFLGVVLNEQEQSVLPLNHALNSALLRAISAHPFKTEESMMTFHEAVFYNRLPLFPFPKASRDQPVPTQLRPLCVYNPMRQFEVSGFMLRECSPIRPQRPRKLQKGYVIYLHNHHGSRERARSITSQLRQHNIEPVLFNGVDGSRLLTSKTNLTLNPGELGLRESYRLLFLHLFSETGVGHGEGSDGNDDASGTEQRRAHLGMSTSALGDDLYLVVEDDVIFSPKFERELDTLLQDPRCGSYLSSGSGGVLLLGATIWRNGSYPKVNRYTGGWTLADMDRANHPGTLCYNFNSGVYGTFAFVLDRRAMRLLLTWLNNPRYASRPIDHAWNFLSDQGIPVRAAFPYLVIPRVDTSIIHKTGTHSDAQRRARIHRWYFADGKLSEHNGGGKPDV